MARLLFSTIVIILALFGPYATAQHSSPIPIDPETLEWDSPPEAPGVSYTWVLGGEEFDEPYLLRVKVAAGTRIAPHMHPDVRWTTVMSGSIMVGFDREFDEAKMKEIPAGSVFEVPAWVPHYVIVKDVDAEYQEAGLGPTGTTFLDK